MKKKLLKFFIIMALICLLLTLTTTNVQAALQSNPKTHYKKTDYSSAWMAQFRNMEISGGALGLSETINSTTMLATSESNNLDSHQVKSTEYGAAAILSASGYGNSTTLQKSTIKTTTGNETGVYFSGRHWEWVAGGLSGSIFSGVNRRYFDAYGKDNTSAKTGDALGTSSTTNPGSAGWHSASESLWNFSEEPYFRRGSGGLFSFNNDYNHSWIYYSRGVVVCGEGL